MAHQVTVSPPLARRIDRLAVRAHRFHRWAHHPLCTSYAGETLRLGRKTIVCRGCALVASGLLAGMILGATLKRISPPHGPSALWSGAALAVSGATLWRVTSSRIAGRDQRSSKLLSRFLPALLAASVAMRALLERSLWGAVPLALLGAGTAALVARYRRRGPNRSPCLHCPERLASAPCSGIQPLLRRERAFRRLAQRWLDTPPQLEVRATIVAALDRRSLRAGSEPVSRQGGARAGFVRAPAAHPAKTA